jgi:aminopeptidase N
MKKIFWLLSTVLLCELSFGQTEPPAPDSSWKDNYRATATKTNDLVHTKLDIRFDYSKSYAYGKVWITLHPHFYATDSLNLDAKGMDIHKVALFSQNKYKPLEYRYDGMNLFIKLDRQYK